MENGKKDLRVVFATLVVEDAKKVVDLESRIELVVPSTRCVEEKRPLPHTIVPKPCGKDDGYAGLVQYLIFNGCVPTPNDTAWLEENGYIPQELAMSLKEKYNALPEELR